MLRVINAGEDRDHLPAELGPAGGHVGDELVPVAVLDDVEHQDPGDEALLLAHTQGSASH